MTQSIERTSPAEPTGADMAAGAGPTDGVDAANAADRVIAEALGVIDSALGRMVSRELVSSGEVADLLLDLRTALTATPGT